MFSKTTTSPDSGKILIVGGYGEVGRSIAEQLAPLFPRRVLVAGRNLDKAEATVAEIGDGARGLAVDIFAEDCGAALEGVALVVVCLDQTDTRFVEECLSRGIHYVDVSADDGFLSEVEKLDDLAGAHQHAGVPGAGENGAGGSDRYPLGVRPR